MRKRSVSAGVQLFWLTFAHAVVDSYALIVPFLLPLLLDRFAPIDRREFYAGALAAMTAFASSIGQVGFAFFADRAKNPVFMWGGLAVAAIGMPLLGYAPSLLVASLLILLGGLGVAAFHPQAAVAAGRLARHARGFGISFFITGGNIGQALGPFLLIFALALWGPRVFLPAIVPGLLLALLLIKLLSGVAADNNTEAVSNGGPTGPIPYRPLVILYLLVTLRTVTVVGFVNFLALYLDARTETLLETLGFLRGLLDEAAIFKIGRAGVQSGFLLFGSIGILIGGTLSDRFPRMPLLVGSMLIPAPLFVAALYVEGAIFIALFLVGNFLFQFSTPIYIVLGQETMPDRANVASSLVMGAAWGSAGLLYLPIGAIANTVGLTPTLTGLALLPAASCLLLWLLPRAQAHAAAVSSAVSSGAAKG